MGPCSVTAAADLRCPHGRLSSTACAVGLLLAAGSPLAHAAPVALLDAPRAQAQCPRTRVRRPNSSCPAPMRVKRAAHLACAFDKQDHQTLASGSTCRTSFRIAEFDLRSPSAQIRSLL